MFVWCCYNGQITVGPTVDILCLFVSEWTENGTVDLLCLSCAVRMDIDTVG